ncbi:MAG: hypothetical protein NVS9B2_01380 [Steroidobacteraceae bacterium]
MVQLKGWGRSRYVALVAVSAFHLAILAALTSASRTRIVFSSTDQPVELLFLPAANTPKIRAEKFRPLSLSGDTAISLALPVVRSALDSASPAGLEDGGGPGVDWKAEARRALQAFEIRNRQPPVDSTFAASPADDTWWPQGSHRDGARFKTADGDWIVWINSSCYQVATSASTTGALDAMRPQAVCSGEANPSRAELLHPPPAPGQPQSP